jgi:uncharacterized protein YbaA (DUF1428 family)
MTQYVDGFLLPIPKDKVDVYKSLAKIAGEVWIEHGALAYWETLEDDFKTDGVSFRTCADAHDNEFVVLAWVVYPSQEERARILAAVMADSRLNCNSEMPFDMKRMAYGGFKPLVVFNKN